MSRAVALAFGMASRSMRRREYLRPVDVRILVRRERERDAHLGEARLHDVLAVARTLEPALHHTVGRLLARRDVLARAASRRTEIAIRTALGADSYGLGA